MDWKKRFARDTEQFVIFENGKAIGEVTGSSQAHAYVRKGFVAMKKNDVRKVLAEMKKDGADKPSVGDIKMTSLDSQKQEALLAMDQDSKKDIAPPPNQDS